MNQTYTGKDFGLNNLRACIVEKKFKDKYMEYQDEYRNEFGVYPELDKVKHPFTARWDDVYNCFCKLRKCNIIGALAWHDMYNRFRKKLRDIYETYSYQWSFFISIGSDYGDIFDTIINMEPSENIVNQLGYRKDENGNYFEGTWKNDKLIYGLVYLANQNVFYVGSFDESGNSDCKGVRFDMGNPKSNKNIVEIIATSFRLKNNALTPYEGSCLIVTTHTQNNEIQYMNAVVGQYNGGYEEGLFITKKFSNWVHIRWDKFRDGKIKTSTNLFEIYVLRSIMSIYLFSWYIIKFVYGYFFFIIPIYYSNRKKNWQI